MINPKENLSNKVAVALYSTQSGSFGPVLRGLLVACTALKHQSDSGGVYLDSPGWKFRALAELIENAAAYAERNNL